MNLSSILYFDLNNWLYGMAIVGARIMPSFIVLPFFSTNILTGAIRYPVAMIVGVSLWPYRNAEIPEYEYSWLLLLISKELFIGLFIAFFLCLPCWVLHAVGSFIDNQRGATLSSNLDPISGIDTSELANFFNIFAAVVVIQAGGFRILLEVFDESYTLWEPYSMTVPQLNYFISFLGLLLKNAIILASPIIVVFLLTELMLGLLARFSPQLNPFALALTVKSLIAFMMMLIYFSPIFPDRIVSLFLSAHSLPGWGMQPL